MGWYFNFHWRTKADAVRELTQYEKNEKSVRQCLAHSVRGNHLWSVVSVATETEEGLKTKLYIGLDLLRFDRTDQCYGNKPLSESSHPYYYDCPLSYLEMVPEENAEWRAKIRALAGAAKRAKEFRASLKIGDVIRLQGKTIPQVTVVAVNPVVGEYQGCRYRLTPAALRGAEHEAAYREKFGLVPTA